VIHTLIVKAIRACNLRCPYCYYINEETENYGLSISAGTLERLFEAFAEYADGRTDLVEVIWHGGEPLMLGRPRLQRFLDLQSQYFTQTHVRNSLQTNGVLLDDAWIDFFAQNAIHVGISLDGTPEIHDRYRVNLAGRGTYNEVVRGIRLMANHGQPTGVLAVAAPDGDGGATMRQFRALGVQACDLLIPMTNHALQRRADGTVDMTGVGRFLRSAFEDWTRTDDPSQRVRLFEGLIMNAVGLSQNCSNAGSTEEQLAQYVVVETNGDICMDTEFGEIDRYGVGAEYKTGFNVSDPSFRFQDLEAALRQRIRTKHLGDLPEDCVACPVNAVCRGSHPASRFDDSDASFDHRSAYCEAMFGLCQDVVTFLSDHGLEKSLRTHTSGRKKSEVKGERKP
jgi:uncharacterized protein